MAFTVYTPRDYGEQQEAMWVGMGYDHHLRHIERRSILPVFTKYLSPGARILEAGCGFGGWVYYLNQRQFRAVGVDLNASVLGQADRSMIPLCRGDVLKLCFDDDQFDAYLSLGVVEHFPDGPGSALAEARRVIKPGGYILVSTPTTNLFRDLVNHPIRRVFDLMNKVRGRRLNFAEYRFTKRELVEHVRAAGFDVLETVPNDTRLDQSEYSIGFFTDWPPLRSSEKFKLNAAGRVVFRMLKAVSPYLVVSGILVVGRKPEATGSAR
jgi:SAM-dependent methyltransferase